MRATLYAIGAILLVVYPVALLLALSGNLDGPTQNIRRAPATLSVGMSRREVEGATPRGMRRLRRPPTIRRHSSSN